jgi:SAM-dependent methyltransferase
VDLRDRLGGVSPGYFANRGKLYLLEALINRLGFQGPMRILSVGCGDGQELEVLSSYGPVDIIDIDGGAIETVPRGLYSKAYIADICDFRPEGRYDLAVGLDVLEHIRDDSRALEGIRNCLADDGFFIFTVPAHQWLFSAHDRALSHFRRYDRASLRKLLEKDFQVIFISYRYFFIGPLVAANKMINRNSAARLETPRMPRPANTLLIWIMRLEATMLRLGICLPWGMAVAGICRPSK